MSMMSLFIDLYPLEKGVGNVISYIADHNKAKYLKTIPVITGWMYSAFFAYVLYTVLSDKVDFMYSRITHIGMSVLSIILISGVLLKKFYGQDYCEDTDQPKKVLVSKTITIMYIIYMLYLVIDTHSAWSKYSLMGSTEMRMTVLGSSFLFSQNTIMAALKTYLLFQ